MMQRADALVMGGGPAGATAAILLAEQGWSVVLVERKPFPRRKVCGEYLSATNWPLLRRLGVQSAMHDMAGPEVRNVGLLCADSLLTAPLPRGTDVAWGRALAREHLDTLLLNRARELGVSVLQPWSAVALARKDGELVCGVESAETGQQQEWVSPVVLGAHGSWETGSLPTQVERPPARPHDLLGFKAHFQKGALPPGLMPLLSFYGGYGGMVHCDGGRFSLSLCIRRGVLESLERAPGEPAGEAVLRHVVRTCPAAGRVLQGAVREGAWLAAGPIRPGIRLAYREGVFCVGNAAGEAHPVVAEGISMAMQSAWLLTSLLAGSKQHPRNAAARDSIGRTYAADWKRSFGPRIRAAAWISAWAMRPDWVRKTLPLVSRFPAFLTWGARLSGKCAMLVT